MSELSSRTLRLALENAATGIFVVDPDCRIRFWNRAAEAITGRTAEQMSGHRCCDLEHSDCGMGQPGDNGHCSLFKDRSPVSQECRIERPDGRSVRVLRTASPLYDPEGKLLGAVETLTELSAPEHSLAPAPELPRILDEGSPVPGMLGGSEVMKQAYRLMRFAADSESSVLLTGESGTGKELAARAIHRLSKRSEGPFVAVNCSALPESLLESELFGHVRGAFTGAVANKVGRIELASGGVIFLDEIGDISPLIQLKLLRFLQEREYQRVGESTTRKADVRVITATHRDLYQMVRRGEFREDLFFRLKVFPINLPPLRERKGDIPSLLEHFVLTFNRRTGKHVRRVHPEALRLLLDYCWPGNVRELEHAVEYAFVLCQGEEIGTFELPQELLRAEFRRQFCQQSQTGSLNPDWPEADSVIQPATNGADQRQVLLGVLNRTGWNRNEAARLLGVSRVTLWKRMKKLGLTGSERTNQVD